MKTTENLTFYHSKFLTMVIHKLKGSKYKLVGTLKARINCTFLVVDEPYKLETYLNKIKNNKKELLKLLNGFKLGLDWFDVVINQDNSNFRFIGNFVNDADKINSFVNRFLEIIKS